MKMVVEVVRRDQALGQADALLYTPLHLGIGVKHSRVYQVEIDGDERAARDFLRQVLLDEVSQDWREHSDAFEDGVQFVLDYGMKPGALDLEKEAIMQFYHRHADLGFELRSLRIQQRLAFFGEAAVAHAAKFVKDVVNPAVHQHQLLMIVANTSVADA